LTLVYQIEQGCTLLWIGKDRTVESFEQFFTLIGKPLSEGVQFVCSDMWKPYLRVIRERCGCRNALRGAPSRCSAAPSLTPLFSYFPLFCLRDLFEGRRPV
jgi:hypothetical protein